MITRPSNKTKSDASSPLIGRRNKDADMQSNYSGLTGMTGMIEMPEVDADAKAQLSEMA